MGSGRGALRFGLVVALSSRKASTKELSLVQDSVFFVPAKYARCLGLALLAGWALGCGMASDEEALQVPPSMEERTPTNPDRNGDGFVNILLLGSSESLGGGLGFSMDLVATELAAALVSSGLSAEALNVVAEDIHKSKPVVIGLGQNGAEYEYMHHSHSLAQYYYWPEDQVRRWANLKGEGEFPWDHVVIAPDPYLVSTLPGYSAFGVHKIAAKVAAGGGQPLLLMVWPQGNASEAILDRMEQVAVRVGAGASVPFAVGPAAAAWREVTAQDTSRLHPSPRGAELSAAVIYSQITQEKASGIEPSLAEVAWSAVQAQRGPDGLWEDGDVLSPFSGAGVREDIISYHHTGSSSERGILGGLNWVFEQASETLQNGGESPINFNYGRANSNFEPNKRYQVDPERFQFSFGFPMQDNGNHGDVSMLYGLDRRDSGTLNDTDLGVAQFMVAEGELPQARAVPIRTLFAQLREAIPEQSAYRDAWHMHRDLDKASGAFMYTLLTGKCALGPEPQDRASADWRSWTAHRIGYSTAWTLMHWESAPACP